ncbi:sensor protein ZraS [Geobacter sp. OR-1]|uniref:sensor histidine kinase n=1 Tax=Geobacter sp. OR-1 TaxID=1266765 RepID=UPI000541BD75|nr:ATP-binding protein [Geobacter sp. OR-1]GAM08118.1 sensor protein ZraS [Geobacter sp. OR-1]
MEPKLIKNIIEKDTAIDSRFLNQLAYNEKMAELGQLAVGVIHELNTPLSVIAAATQLIMREERLPEHVFELLERIGTEAQRLSQISRSILTFGRLDSGEGCEADINLVIRDVLQLLVYEIQKRSVQISQRLDHGIPILSLDAGRLKQIFINLVMNALHAMEGGGAITITSARSGDDICEIRVSDTGHGIPPQELENIFEPFYTTKKAGEGTGLGLFVTREIVTAMGGSIAVESRQGIGTCFILRFPLSLP